MGGPWHDPGLLDRFVPARQLGLELVEPLQEIQDDGGADEVHVEIVTQA